MSSRTSVGCFAGNQERAGLALAWRRRGSRGPAARAEGLENRLLLATIYVDANPAIVGTRDGKDWDTAYADLQLALEPAVSGDEIRVADGTYKPTSTTTRTVSFVLESGVSLYGGYAGFGAAVPNARDVAAYPTILSGDIGTAGTKTDNSYHVVKGSSADATAVLDGFTITGGYANGSSANGQGGGMYNSAGSPTVTSCTFSGNAATSGGGIYNATSSSPAVTNCVFGGNAATNGGGMYNASSSSPVVTNCVFSCNTASTNGGGMYNTASSPTVINCTLSGNTATAGGIYNASSSSAIVTNCIIWGNGGAAISNSSSTPTVSYSDIQGGYTGTTNINSDPPFVRSPWAGPDGAFATADDDYGDLRLRAGSPCLDTGSNAAIPAGITTDLAGNDRIQNAMVDMGAYEGAIAVSAKTIFVDINAGGANTGTSWDDAFISLASALSVAADGDTVRVADGIYKPTTTTDRTRSLALRRSVAVYGGYAGSVVDPDARDIAAYPSILSGDIGAGGSASDNSYHVLTATLTGASTVLDGFTVTGGIANGSGGLANGGGLCLTNASPTISNCTVVRNAASSGGGIYSSASSPALLNCAFNGNTASSNGGAMYNAASSLPTVTNCIFSGNTASDSGGGLYNTSSSPLLTNCTLACNGASSNSGGIYNSSSSPTLANCVVWNNGSAPIYTDSGTPTLTYSDIQGTYSGTGNINSDPLFLRSPWSGPDGAFGTADDEYGNLRLREGSPCLDTGSNAAVPAGITTDMAGNVRIQNGTVDMGAYEGPSAPPEPQTIYVDVNADGANDGTSWDDAFNSLQSALSSANDLDAIHVADGTYKPTTTTDQTISFVLRNWVGVYGGYAGSDAADPDARNTVTTPSILSGDIGTAGDKYDNSYRVVVGSGTNATAILDGFTITKGKSNYNGWGGGMVIENGSPTVSNCTITGNEATNAGGLYCANSSPTITDCQFIGNYGTNYGGVFNGAGSAPTYSNCIFKGNTTDGPGGGMTNSACSPTIINCTFSNNEGHNYAGGMYNVGDNSNCKPIITDCTFYGNNANSGGGMTNRFANPIVSNCYFIANTSLSGGAVYTAFCKTLSFTNCVFVGNYARDSGGAFHNYYNQYGQSSPVLTNCTLAGNKSAVGGAIRTEMYTVVVLRNCIVWDNTTTTGNQISNASGSSTDIAFCDIQDGTVGDGNLNSDPLFLRNPYIGSDGKWNTADDDYGDLRPWAVSPVVDMGSSGAVPVGMVTDIDGHDRFVDVPGVNLSGLAVDMGAYEANPTILAAGDVFYLRRSADGANIHLWRGTDTSGAPDETFATATLQGLILPGTAADSSLFVDMSNGSLFPGGIIFNAGDGNDTMTFISPVSGESFIAGPADTRAGSAIVNPDSVELTRLDAAVGSVIQLGTLSLCSAVQLVNGKNLVLRPGGLTITDAGRLDLTDNDMILDYAGATPLVAVRQWLRNGRIDHGPAIISSSPSPSPIHATGLGLVDNALVNMSSFAGQTLASPFSQILVKHTYAGDTDFDGMVTDADLYNLVGNMGRTETQWFLGDLDHDGQVSLADFAELTANLGAGAGGGGVSPLLVPPQSSVAKTAPAAVATKTKAKPLARKASPRKMRPTLRLAAPDVLRRPT